MHLIKEGRVEDVRNKYFKSGQQLIKPEIFDNLVRGSESIASNHKYLDWMVDRWVKLRLDNPDVPVSEKESVEELITAVDNFERVKNRLEQKDIYQYETLDELFKTLTAIDSKQRREVPTREDAENIYETDRYVVVVPETKEASC